VYSWKEKDICYGIGAQCWSSPLSLWVELSQDWNEERDKDSFRENGTIYVGRQVDNRLKKVNKRQDHLNHTQRS